VGTGKEVRSFSEHLDGVKSVAFSPDGRLLVTGSWDASVKIWDRQTGELLITLYSLNNDDWVVVTPDGRFDGSPNGIKLIHYVQNNSSIPLDSFFDSFYTPQLFARVLSKEPDQLLKPTVDIASVVASMPPMVKIVSPKPGQTFMDQLVQITIETTDQGGGINEVRLFQNGKALPADDNIAEKQLGGKRTTHFRAELVSGMNEFRATAFNTDRTESPPQFQDTLRIELKAAQPDARLHVLAIGIKNYLDSRIDLPHAEDDAKKFLEAVDNKRSQGIFKEIIAYPVYSREATPKRIEAEFKKVAAAARPQDVFIFFYSGHGTTSVGSATNEPDFYFALTEVTQLYGNDALLEQKGLSGRQLRKFLEQIKALKQLVVIDACEAGTIEQAFKLRGPIEDKAIAQLHRSSGTHFLMSTGANQYAAEIEKLRHGVFTYALLNGLAGEAAQKGKVTVNTMAAYLADKVPELSREYRGYPQYPKKFTTAGGDDFPLALGGGS
jgi:hypothetical protein